MSTTPKKFLEPGGWFQFSTTGFVFKEKSNGFCPASLTWVKAVLEGRDQASVRKSLLYCKDGHHFYVNIEKGDPLAEFLLKWDWNLYPSSKDYK